MDSPMGLALQQDSQRYQSFQRFLPNNLESDGKIKRNYKKRKSRKRRELDQLKRRIEQEPDVDIKRELRKGNLVTILDDR